MMRSLHALLFIVLTLCLSHMLLPTHALSRVRSLGLSPLAPLGSLSDSMLPRQITRVPPMHRVALHVTPATGHVYTDPTGLFSVPIPTKWTVRRSAAYVVLVDPEHDFFTYALVVTGTDIPRAVATAWAMVLPTLTLTVAGATGIPSSRGVQRAVVVNYRQTGPTTVYQGFGQLFKGRVYILLFRGSIAAAQKRNAQVQIIASGFTILGMRQVNLTGVTPVVVTPAITAALQRYLVAQMKLFKIPAAEVAIVQHGAVVYAHGFGMRGPDDLEAVTPDTRMMIGSTTKSMTTMLMGMLIDQHKLTWDEPVVKIMPQFTVSDPHLTKKITVRDLVCACSGVPRRDAALFFKANALTARQIVRSLALFPLVTKRGEAFQYSNQMVATGGYVAAMAAGGTFDNLYASYVSAMQQRVLAPIGMDHSTFSFDAIRADGNYASPYGMRIDGTYAPMPLSYEQFVTPIAPAGALWSTANDMARYLITEINRGIAPNGKRVVSTANLAVTWQPQVQVTAQTSYGLGWFIDTYKGQTIIDHGGNTLGFTSDLAFLPNAGLGIVVLTNAQATNLFNEAIRYRLVELLFKQPFEYDREVTAARTHLQAVGASLRLAPTIDAAAVMPFLGTFSNRALGAVTLTLNEGTLRLKAPSFTTTLRAIRGSIGQGNAYVFIDPPLVGVTLRFARDPHGKPILILDEGVDADVFTRTQSGT